MQCQRGGAERNSQPHLFPPVRHRNPQEIPAAGEQSASEEPFSSCLQCSMLILDADFPPTRIHHGGQITSHLTTQPATATCSFVARMHLRPRKTTTGRPSDDRRAGPRGRTRALLTNRAETPRARPVASSFFEFHYGYLSPVHSSSRVPFQTADSPPSPSRPDPAAARRNPRPPAEPRCAGARRRS